LTSFELQGSLKADQSEKRKTDVPVLLQAGNTFPYAQAILSEALRLGPRPVNFLNEILRISLVHD
jgi:hypothetical protein